jgi:hypothetical protein
MTIDYTLRLYNKSTSENVIRAGSMTIFNPNKYGKNLAKISLDGEPQSHTVYNKIFQKAFETSAFNVILGNQNSQIQIQEKKVAAPVFFHKSNVMLSSRNALINSTELGNEVVYGQGKMILPIDPTDNFIRFNIYKQVSTSNAPVPMSLNLNSTFRISFGKNSKLEFTNMKNAAYENLQYGQIAFKIAKEQALKVLDLTDDLFIMTVISEDGTESMLYTGKWRSSTAYQSIIENEKASANEILEAQRNADLIASMTKKISELESQVTFWQKRAAVKTIKVGTALVQPSLAINAISALPVSRINDPAQISSTNVTNVINAQSTTAATPAPIAQIIKGRLNSNKGLL